MSITLIRDVFQNLTTYDSWSLQLLQIKNSKRNGTTYFSREISLSPPDALTKFVREISESYCSNENGIDNKYESISDYDGSANAKIIYKLSYENDLIANDYQKLINIIANPDAEVDPLKFNAQAYILKGMICLYGSKKSVKLVSMQNPVTSLRHKYLCSNGKFTEISDKVISLRSTIDVVILDNTVYLLTLAGEKLFNMERAYKSVCQNKIEIILNANIVNNSDLFSKIASSSHNPRKFISFNESHLQMLNDADNRRKLSKKFNIPLDGDKFDVSKNGAADKLVKLLCDRGMVDPFDETPMEVSSSKKWE